MVGDLGVLLGGQLVSLLGNRLTLVAIPYQVYELINTDLSPRLWPLSVLTAVAAGLTGFDNPTRNAIVPRLVGGGSRFPGVLSVREARWCCGR